MQTLDYDKKIAEYPILSQKEERKLFIKLGKYKNKQAKGARAIVDKIVKHNIRLVYSAVSKIHRYNVPREDLVQQGMLGLLHAIGKFDVHRQLKFSTYSMYWIKQKVMKYRKEQARMLHIGVHVHSLHKRIRQSYITLYEELDRVPTEQEIADSLKVPVESIRRCIVSFYENLSLDAELLNRPYTMHEIVPDKESDLEEKANMMLLDSRRKELNKKLKRLNEKELTVILYLYGLIDGRAHTCSEIGDIMGLCRERIRQLKDQSFKKLGIDPSKSYINLWSIKQ